MATRDNKLDDVLGGCKQNSLQGIIMPPLWTLNGFKTRTVKSFRASAGTEKGNRQTLALVAENRNDDAAAGQR